MAQLECPRIRNTCVSFTFGEFPFYPLPDGGWHIGDWRRERPFVLFFARLTNWLWPCRQYEEMVYYGRLGKKAELFWNKISLTGSIWSSLNAPRSYTQTHTHTHIIKFLKRKMYFRLYRSSLRPSSFVIRDKDHERARKQRRLERQMSVWINCEFLNDFLLVLLINI